VRILITGSTGFIGSYLSYYLHKKGYEVYGLGRSDRKLYHYRDVIVKEYLDVNGEYNRILCNILDYPELTVVFDEVKPDIVIHLAAQADVMKSYHYPEYTFEVNFKGTRNVLEASIKSKVKYLIYQSTDKVYGSTEDAREDSPYKPVDFYSISKVAADRLAQTYMDKLDICILRPCNIYGLDLNFNRLIPYCILECQDGRKPKIRNPHAVRQFLYIMDYLHAVELCIDKRLTGIYNIGSNDILEVGYVAGEICRRYGLSYESTEPDKYKPEATRQSVNWDKIKNEGFRPRYSFNKALDETIEQYNLLFKLTR